MFLALVLAEFSILAGSLDNDEFYERSFMKSRRTKIAITGRLL